MPRRSRRLARGTSACSLAQLERWRERARVVDPAVELVAAEA
ncbi:hypothetical protein [Pseudenhygromyxa sp. WMMC2535]|nr:hypothetical protein [Pseudenhygromyxa sp. WMMC2535]